MNKILYLVGLLSTIFTFLGSFFKIMHWQGASVMIIMGTILMVGFIFKLMHWPWATVLMLSPILIFNFVYIPLYFISRFKREELKFYTIVNSVVMFSFGSILLALFDLTA